MKYVYKKGYRLFFKKILKSYKKWLVIDTEHFFKENRCQKKMNKQKMKNRPTNQNCGMS